jgi:hypothetical protein
MASSPYGAARFVLEQLHSERMLPVKLLELLIDLRQMLKQVCRSLEELLAGHRKELGRSRAYGSIGKSAPLRCSSCRRSDAPEKTRNRQSP